MTPSGRFALRIWRNKPFYGRRLPWAITVNTSRHIARVRVDCPLGLRRQQPPGHGALAVFIDHRPDPRIRRLIGAWLHCLLFISRNM